MLLRQRGVLNHMPTPSSATSAHCGHAWDLSLHTACPRCAIAAVEQIHRKVSEIVQRIYTAACPAGSDYGNGEIARLAQEALRVLAAGEASAAKVREVTR